MVENVTRLKKDENGYNLRNLEINMERLKKNKNKNRTFSYFGLLLIINGWNRLYSTVRFKIKKKRE